MTIDLTISIATITGLLGLAIKTAMDYQKLKTNYENQKTTTETTIKELKLTAENNIKVLEKAHKADIKNICDRFEEYKEVNAGIYKEIKEEMKEIKSLMMDIIKNLPKRGKD